MEAQTGHETAANPLRRIREALGLTQAQLAEKLRWSRQYVHQLESGTDPIGGNTALRIADAFPDQMAQLGLTVEDLLRAGRAA